MRIITAVQASELDQKSMEDYGVSGIDLMGAAGKEIAENVKTIVAEIHDPRIIIICGKGNNGGDGFATAAWLDKYSVQIFTSVDKELIKSDSAHFHNVCVEKDIKIHYSENPPIDFECDLVIDALLGTGCKGELKDDILKWTMWMNALHCIVLAVDCPTGINGNNGMAASHSVKAGKTITMGFPKLGLIMKQGQDHTGKIKTVDIGFPNIIDDLSGLKWSRFEESDISDLLSKIETDTYKHQQGKVLLIAGSKGMTGAAVLSTFGSLRSGAGLTITCAPESIEDIYEKTIIEGMTIGCPDEENGFLTSDSFKIIKDKIQWCDAIVIGPGLGRSPNTIKMVEKVVLNANKPLIIDADALCFFQGKLENFNKIKTPFIITPHEGEFCNLLKITREEYIKSFPDIVEKFMDNFSGVLVLKNAPTITYYNDKAIVNSSGNPGMATAGMGDVLAGILGTFVSQGMDCFQAAQAGVYIHGLAADNKVIEKGQRGLIASDLLDELPKVLHAFE